VIVIVRHGRTAANAGGLLLGRADPPLDDEGTRQAESLSGACAPLDVVRIVTSPLGRCRQTAEAIAATSPVPVEVDERWIELDYGELDGVPVADVPDETWRRWRVDPEFAPPGGETLATLGTRVREACEELRESALTTDVVVVTHVSPVKAALAWALGAGDEVAWRMFVELGSVATVAFDPWGAQLRAFNQVPLPAPSPRASPSSAG
jgi:broad specificity phosphatase PhoE